MQVSSFFCCVFRNLQPVKTVGSVVCVVRCVHNGYKLCCLVHFSLPRVARIINHNQPPFVNLYPLFYVAPSGYTHVARDEVEDAEASAKLALGIIDRHPAVLHLPLTFTLAESSRRLLQQPRIDRPSRRLGQCADSLRVARASLAFARPTGASGQEAGDDHGAEKGKTGGWCPFGDAIMAAFVKRGGGDVSAEVNKAFFFSFFPALVLSVAQWRVACGVTHQRLS